MFLCHPDHTSLPFIKSLCRLWVDTTMQMESEVAWRRGLEYLNCTKTAQRVLGRRVCKGYRPSANAGPKKVERSKFSTEV